MQPVPIHDAEADQLASLQADFPQFRIWREITFNRRRYIARGRHPHTVVTPDLDELRAELSANPGDPAAGPAESGRSSSGMSA